MGDLVCGFEEMQGVKLGYLLIKGKQMFALSQVFTDLLKNIPRTTVHKRMDYLNVKKHHCCLEELRKLKAIKSIAFHAAKCTLISREDVEALYFSCKTERVLKSNKRKVTPSSHGDTHNGLVQLDTHAGLWKDKVWFSLHGVPETISYLNKAGRVEVPCFPDSELPPIDRESHERNNNIVSKFDCKSLKNYETTRVNGNRTTFNEKDSFFRRVVNRQPLLFQSAVDTRCKLTGSTSDLLHKRKRRRDRASGRNSAKYSWSRRRHTHHPPVLLVQPQCCSKQKTPTNITLGPVNLELDYDFYLNQHPRQHHDRQQSFQESCSSDTESSSYSERVNNDSDFGSSFSTSSNSGTSEEDEDDSPSESSDVSSDEESSTQSDSSSVSSQVSLQSIRFRRPGLASLSKTLNSKAPLLLQPTFQYNHQQQQLQKPQQRTSGCYGIPESNYRINKNTANEFSSINEVGALRNQKCDLPMQGSPLTELSGGVVTGQNSDPKRSNGGDFATSTYNGDKVFLQRRTQGSANKCPPGLSPHCAQNKDAKILRSTNSHQFSLTINLKREVKTSTNLKAHSNFKNIKTIKTEADETQVTAGSQTDSFLTCKTPPLILKKCEIKVEESCEEYEQSSHTGPPCERDNGIKVKGQCPCEDIKQADYVKNATNAPGSSSWGPKSPSYSQEFQVTHNTPPDGREFTNGARVRKNYTTLLLKSTNVVSKKLNKRVSACTIGKGYSSYTYSEDLSRESKLKRPASTLTSFLKKPFSLLENFPFPPSLVVGSDGDLSPAYSMNSLRNHKPPARSHPVWRWEAGEPPVPTALQGIRKC